MLNTDWILKIADFGYATILQGKRGDGKLTTYLGTLSYAAPEILMKQPYFGANADIFSCGVILFVLVTGKLPYGKAVASDSFYKNFINNDYETFWSMIGPKIGVVSNEFKSLVSLLLAYDPIQRPTISEIKNHPWFKINKIGKDEMSYEFLKRKTIVVENRIKEAKQKEEKKRGNNRVVKGNVKSGGAEDLLEDIDELTINELKLDEERNLCDFNDDNPYNVKFNESNQNKIFTYLHKYLNKENKNKEIKISDNNYSFKVKYNLDKETEQQLEGLMYELLEVKFDIKKLDEKTLVVELTKLSGCKHEFSDVYDEFVNFNQAL